MAKRELPPLESAIDKTVKSGLEEKMAVQLQMARSIADSLKVLEVSVHASKDVQQLS